MDQIVGARRYRTVFLSDIHLGARECQAELLLDFLRDLSCERLYLIGDIVDGWKFKSGWHWPQTHNDVVQKLLRLARKGALVTYVPGNHDDKVRDFCGVHFGGVEVAREAVHETADGRRLLVVHGDEFDGLVRRAAWRLIAGDLAYKAVIALNTVVADARRRLGLSYWSLSASLKGSLSRARAFIETFEESAAAEAARRGLDGVVCGHIHRAALREVGGVTYANDGDWVESCTALVEHMDGRLEIVDWAALHAVSVLETGYRIEELVEPAPA